MKATLALLSAALAVSACTRVIERPVPSSAPSVVTTPAISERVVERSSASGSTVPAGSCMWNGQPTSNGGISCQQGTQYRCNGGTWTQTALSCSPSQ